METTIETYEDKIELLLTDARGIYIPRDFTDLTEFHDSVTEGDREILADPEHEYYWEVWENVLNTAYAVINGVRWTIYQEGDLWAVRDDMTDNDWEEWLG